MARSGENAAAFAGRGHCGAGQHRRWAREVIAAASAAFTGRACVSFPGGPGSARVAHGPDIYARLAAVKSRYDPGNFFLLNQYIPPDAGS